MVCVLLRVCDGLILSPQSVFTLQPKRETHVHFHALGGRRTNACAAFKRRAFEAASAATALRGKNKKKAQQSHCVVETHLTLAASCSVAI